MNGVTIGRIKKGNSTQRQREVTKGSFQIGESMKITELPMGSQVTVRSGLGTDFLDFESKIIKNNPKEDAVFLEPIRQNNRTLDFSSGRLINTASVVSDRDDKAYVYHNVKIDYVHEEDQGYHRIITPDDVEAVNRRKYFRMYLGTDGVMQGGSHKKTYNITVKDISVNGFAVVCSIDADLDLGARTRISFTDRELRRDFRIRGLIVRKTEIDPTTVIYGCKLPYESDAIGKYIAMKQRMHRAESKF